MKKRFGFIVAIILLILLFFTLRNINFQEVYDHFTKIQPIFIILAFLSCTTMLLLVTLRLKYSLRSLVDANYFFLVKVLFASFFVNTLTPGSGIGGEPISSYFLSKKYKKSRLKFFGYIVADKLFNFLVYVLLIIFSLLFVIVFLNIPFITKLLPQLVVIAIFAIGLMVFVGWKANKYDPKWLAHKLFKFRSIRRKFKKISELESFLKTKINNFVKIFKKVFINKRTFLVGTLISLAFWIFNFLISYFLFISFDSKISFLSIVIVVILGYLIGDLTPIPGGIGVVESTMILLYSAMGIPPSLAAIVALLSRMIYYFHVLLIGGLTLAYLKWKLK